MYYVLCTMYYVASFGESLLVTWVGIGNKYTIDLVILQISP